MRVGLFTNAYHPFISGVVNSVDLIRKGLLKRGHTPFVFAPEYKGYKDEHAGVFRFRSLDMSRKVQFPIPIPFSTKLFPMIAKMDLDIIHSHHPLLLGDVGVYFSRKLKVPMVYTFHTQLEQYSHYIPLNQAMVKTLARSAIVNYTQKCDLVIAPSPTIRELLDEYEVETRVETLENAIDISAFEGGDRAKIRRRHGIGEHEMVAMYAGRIGLEKNLEFLIHSFASLPETLPARLLLVGSGLELPMLRELVEQLKADDRILFTDRVDYHEMVHHYAAADLFVMTSTTEVKPLVVLEAMSASLPVVAVAACGTEDTIEHGVTGLLCDLDQQAYRQLLVEALSQPDRLKQMGAKARQTVTRYSIDQYTDRLLALYQELTAGEYGAYKAVEAV